MEEKIEDMVREFNRLDKELDDLYHEIALKIGIPDSAFTIFYIICCLGDGCHNTCCRKTGPTRISATASLREQRISETPDQLLIWPSP